MLLYSFQHGGIDHQRIGKGIAGFSCPENLRIVEDHPLIRGGILILYPAAFFKTKKSGFPGNFPGGSITALFFVAAAFLLLGSAVGSSRAALTYYSEQVPA